MKEISIRIKGHIDTNWSDWLGELTVIHTRNGDTVLNGFLRDQSAVYGLLTRLGDLGLQLVALTLASSDSQITNDKSSEVLHD